MAGPLTLTDETFPEALAREPLLVVDVWAEWCGPCRVLGPIVERLSSEFDGRVVFAKLDVDLNPATADRFVVRTIPSLLFFEDGALVDRTVGSLPESLLRAKVEQLIKNAAAKPRAA